MIRSLRRILYLNLLAVVLTACVTGGQQWDPSDYTVKSGDTLYSIAWRYELDPDDLARWNNLGDNSVIHPGERLHTRGSASSGYSASEASVADVPVAGPVPAPVPTPATPRVLVVGRGDTLYSLARRHRLDVKQLIRANRLKRPYLLHPGQKLYVQVQQATSPAIAPPSIAQRPSVSSYPDVVRWSWPLRGKIVSGFNDQNGEAKGIDIAGHAGEDVHAAAAGKVVYSGNGLISFGNLVIIKHNDSFLSAYAHNRNILVSEGQIVSQGQVIAKIGKTETSNSVLHFEIRKHGKPVNPLRYLPHG
jgi:lipoprotein NlpD